MAGWQAGVEMVIEEQPSPTFDLRELETELCRLPDVTAVRLVGDDHDRLTEVHVLAQASKAPKQIVRDVQSVALASFGIEIDRRIVSVVQLGSNGAGVPEPDVTPTRTSRPQIVTVQAQSSARRTTAQVTLATDDDERTGYSEGSVAASARPRLLAEATLDALRQLEPAAECLDIETAMATRAGGHELVVVLLVMVDPPFEQHLAGSAIVQHHIDDAVVRAVLDATNRRLPFLGSDRD